jgi:hypothetical protein
VAWLVSHACLPPTACWNDYTLVQAWTRRRQNAAAFALLGELQYVGLRCIDVSCNSGGTQAPGKNPERVYVMVSGALQMYDMLSDR